MNEEAYKIRWEINNLKKKLKEIEKNEMSAEEHAQACSSAVCGQDEILSIIQKLCKERGQKNLAVMACWEKNENGKARWYVTNASPVCLPYLLRGVENIITCFSPINNELSLKILELMLNEDSVITNFFYEKLEFSEAEINKKLQVLEEKSFIAGDSGKWRLLDKGWKSYIVLAHLAVKLEVDLPIEKALYIAQAFEVALGKQWGEHLGKSFEDIVVILKDSNWLEKLQHKGITLKDIEQAVYENNC
ncbi:hypothetical protein LGL55_01525 [Clostridium tagluense]|uniref:hypothetical protein n=1 Tax=Clostridium tagluense TaxID=360422 RepID=UPI001CF21469|nr:hypothetical protein [Clostridium tagluense]MCB2309796.1 hypothetical protein [Clostridium tagluense]MCB2314674.1 hypothetical protein [Clostridium tagluense]MCB2319522.1 hypothetical protein [Clostridium tagluense]MCB2324390.1 hypothetical protein [Clostridium tagluense]MCB2329241.1 hypothetical protein [Clostridium tagluense]